MLLALIVLTASVADPQPRRRADDIREQIKILQESVILLDRRIRTPALLPAGGRFRDIDTRVPFRNPDLDRKEHLLSQIAERLRRIEELRAELGRIEPEEDMGIPPDY